MTTKSWPDPSRYDTITTAWAIGVLPNAPLQFTPSTTELPHSEYLTVTLSFSKLHIYFHYEKDMWDSRIMRGRKTCVFTKGKSHVWELKGYVCSPAFHPGLSPMTSPLKHGPLLMEIPVSRVFITALLQSHLCQQLAHRHMQARGAARKSWPPITAIYYSPHFPDTT